MTAGEGGTVPGDAQQADRQASRRPAAPVDERIAQLRDGLRPMLAEFLPRQRWFGGDRVVGDVAIRSVEVYREDPLLLWLVLDVGVIEDDDHPGQADDQADRPDRMATYQLLVAGRPEDAEEKFFRGKERVTLGVLDGLMLYDALVDPTLALDVLTVVAPDERADVARPLVVEQSNSSVVYDERLILKLFRRLHPGSNPDVEITRVLGDRDFPHVVTQRAELRRDGLDLAVVRDYLLGATDGWQLAHTSLRDLLGSRLPPEETGGDFAADAHTLGAVTAALHVELAAAFGTYPAEPVAWRDTMRAQAARMPDVDLDGDAITAALDDAMEPFVDAASTDASGGENHRPRGHPSPQNGSADAVAGSAIRIHGDLHLGQFLRSDSGWFVLDFEGEPARPLSERMLRSSPLQDAAGMVRSFHYAARTGLAERGRDVDAELVKLTEAWDERVREAFWRGYLSVPEVVALLPASDAHRQRLLRAFELDKAVYEVVYESKHRPSWVDIPASAIERMMLPKV